MKTKILSIALAACMTVASMPAVASASTADITLGGVDITYSGEPVYAVTDDVTGAVTIGGDEEDYNIKFEGDTLTLRDATIKSYVSDSTDPEENACNYGIEIKEGSPVTMVLEGKNSVSSADVTAPEDYDGKSYGIFLNDDLTVRGNGELYVKAGDVDATVQGGFGYSTGIQCEGGGLTINGGEIVAESGEAMYSVGMNFIASTYLSIDSGDVTAIAETNKEEAGMCVGVNMFGDMDLGDADLAAMARSENAQSIGYRQYSEDDFTISQGTVTVQAEGNNENNIGLGLWGDPGWDVQVIVKGGKLEVKSNAHSIALSSNSGDVATAKLVISPQAGRYIEAVTGDYAGGDIHDLTGSPFYSSQEIQLSELGNYFYSWTTTVFEITEPLVLDKSEFIYNKKAKTPKIASGLGGCVEGTDYDLEYKNNVKVGVGTVIVKGKGKLEGVVLEQDFFIYPYRGVINKLTSTKNSITVTSRDQSAGGITGYQFAWRKTNSGDDWNTKMIKSNRHKLTIKDLKKNTRYTIKVRRIKNIDGERYYGNWSELKKIRTKAR